MNRKTSLIIYFFTCLIALSSCKSYQPPKLDYQALAKASSRLGIEIEYHDNPYLYITSAKWIGTPYCGGGKSLNCTDCSGFTQRIFYDVYRKNLKRTTHGQKKQAKKISKANLREGDLVFFSSNRSHRKVAHVGVYLKNNLFIHASSSKGVIISNLNSKYYKKHWLHGGRI